MKNLILTLLLLTICSRPSQAQLNLVPNPSFEDTLNCDSFTYYIYAGYPWFTPTNCTPDYYYGLNPSCGHSALQNPTGYQLPFDGIAYVGLYMADPNGGPIGISNSRDYICCSLIDTLIFNEDYYIEFFVSRANNFSLATDDIGVYVSSQIPINSGCSYLPYQPQVENSQGNIITDSINWIKISGTFTAQGGEKYLTIGNFKDSMNTTIIDADSGNGLNNNSYYYIDKVSLIPLDSLQGIISFVEKEESIIVFPNIVNRGSSMTVTSNLNNNCTFDLILTEGRKIKSGIIHPGNNQIDSDGLAIGIYILNIVEEKARLSKKIVVY